MTDASAAGRDEDQVAGFVERFASTLTDSGIPRMPSRVFAALVATDSGRLTAGELAGMLRISPAAVSGAVRYLAQVDMVRREREPGSRRDVFRIEEDVLCQVVARRDQMMSRWSASMREGSKSLGEDTPAGRRLVDMLEFFEFMRDELASMLDRWEAHRSGSSG